MLKGCRDVGSEGPSGNLIGMVGVSRPQHPIAAQMLFKAQSHGDRVAPIQRELIAKTGPQ